MAASLDDTEVVVAILEGTVEASFAGEDSLALVVVAMEGTLVARGSLMVVVVVGIPVEGTFVRGSYLGFAAIVAKPSFVAALAAVADTLEAATTA